MASRDCPSSDARVAAIRYGTRPCKKSESFYGYAKYGEPDAECGLDYYFWVVRAGEGVTLVDTGFEADVGIRRGRTVLCSPKKALTMAGVEPGDVIRIILSHMHYDHIGNIAMYPNAEIVVQGRELEFWSGPYAKKTHFVHELEETDLQYMLSAQKEGRVRCVDGDERISPEIMVRLTGGHTVGQQIVVVEFPDAKIVLAADAMHYYEELELDRPYSVFSDLVAVYRGYDILRETIGDGPAVLVAGHDPEVVNRFPVIAREDAGAVYKVA